MKRVNGKRIDGNSGIGNNVDSYAALIQMLIPVALEAVNEALQTEVSCLAGICYDRDGGQLRAGVI